MYGTQLSPGAEVDLDTLMTSCISDQLGTFELNSIDGTDGLIIKGSSLSSISLLRPLYVSLRKILCSVHSNWPLRLSLSNFFEKAKGLEIIIFSLLLTSSPVPFCSPDGCLCLKTSRTSASGNFSSLLALLCCLFRAFSSWRIFFIWISLRFLSWWLFFCLTTTRPKLSDTKLVMMVVKALDFLSASPLDISSKISYTSLSNLCHYSM